MIKIANVLQGIKSQIIPKGLSFSLPRINPLWAMLIGEILLVVFVIFIFLYKFFVYKIRIIVREDRGKSTKAHILHAREVFVNGVKKYKVWGKRVDKKPLLIPATSSDYITPLETVFGIHRDMIELHKDINGDYRPLIPNPEKGHLDIDNQKARGWHSLKYKETFSLYKEKSEFMQKYGNIMIILLVIFTIMMGVYLFVIKG